MSILGDLASKLGIGTDKLRDQLIMGIGIEFEHIDKKAIDISKYDEKELIKSFVDGEIDENDIPYQVRDALFTTAKIATDHLMEIPDYYTRLLKMEEEAKQKTNAKQMPEIYYCRHIEKGVAGYKKENLFLDDTALNKMDKTMKGIPVRVLHVDKVDVDTIQEDSDGYVIESFYNNMDGWHWAKFIVVSDAAHQAIKKGWSVSNAYIPTEFGVSGEHHAIPFDRKVLNGHYTHLAIVPNPRYEGAKIFTEEQFKEYNEAKKLEIQNRKEEKNVMLKFWKKTEVKEAIGEDTMVQIENGQEISLKDMIAVVVNAKKNEDEEKKKKEEQKVNMDMEIEVGDEKMPIKELVNRYMKSAKKNAEDEAKKKAEEEKKNAEAEEAKKKEEEKKNAEAAEAKKKEDEEKEKERQNALEKQKNFDSLNNAIQNSYENGKGEVVADLAEDKLARGKERY